MRNRMCPFCSYVINDKQKYCNHIATLHNDQIPYDCEPLEYAYSMMVNKPTGRLCTECHMNNVHFNQEALKYERLCDDPKCRESYVAKVKGRMRNKYGKEHLLDDPNVQRDMVDKHPNSKDLVWDAKHVFRTVSSYEEDFLIKLKSLDWSPDDILLPSPHTIYYKWKDGSPHFYIPDVEIISLNLIVEIKQGSFNSSYMEHNREIEQLKDNAARVYCKNNGMHYIKILDKNYEEFMSEYVKSDLNQPE